MKSIHKFCSKLYNRIGKPELLDVDTEVVKLGYGFLNFDWDVVKMVKNKGWLRYFIDLINFFPDCTFGNYLFCFNGTASTDNELKFRISLFMGTIKAALSIIFHVCGMCTLLEASFFIKISISGFFDTQTPSGYNLLCIIITN